MRGNANSRRELERRLEELQSTDTGSMWIKGTHDWLDHVVERGADAEPPEAFAPAEMYVPTTEEVAAELPGEIDWREEYPVLAEHFSGLTWLEYFGFTYRCEQPLLEGLLARRIKADDIDIEALRADIVAAERGLFAGPPDSAGDDRLSLAERQRVYHDDGGPDPGDGPPDEPDRRRE